MAVPEELFLYEELMLLALKDEKGTLEADGTRFQYTVAASFLAELLLANRIRVVEAKKKLVEFKGADLLGDPILDECLEKLKTAKRRASLTTWVSRFAGLKKLKHRVAGQLVHRGILRADQDKVLLVFNRKVYPELDPRPEREVIERLRKAIFGDARDVDPRTTVLVSLADKAGVLKNAFDKRDLKRRKERIKQIGAGNVTAAAAQEVIEAVQAAVLVAVIMPAVIGTATSS
jgi:hypothetical protein